LLVQDPWRIALSTDHPNGGSFLAYPQIVQLLMDRTYRQEVIERLPSRVRQRSLLADLDREYTLQEIAIITRAGPARILGLKNKGHLGPGADADITLYTPGPDKRAMFQMPRYVLKAGVVVVENGEIRQQPTGRTLHAATRYDEGALPGIRKWFELYYTLQLANYVVEESSLDRGSTAIPCTR
jgi:formylmethanofuran dehydrogenase subunit A